MAGVKGSFGFSRLDEEEDEPNFRTGNLDLQPHLDNDSAMDKNSNHQTKPTPTLHISGIDTSSSNTDPEHDVNCSVSYEKDVPQSTDVMEQVPHTSEGQSNLSYHSAVEDGKSSVPKIQSEPANGTTRSQDVNIQFSSSEGRVNVMQGAVVTRPDGTRYIDTSAIPNTWSETERKRPLRPERIRLLKIFSIISCLFFFPTGLAAVYYAFKTKTEFDEGVMRGNIDRAQKFAKRSQRFTVLSFIMAIVVGTLIAAIIERPDYHHHNHRGSITG